VKWYTWSLAVPLVLLPGVVHGQAAVIGGEATKRAIVWKSIESMNTGIRLMTAGSGNPDLLPPYIACVPAVGDTVVILQSVQSKTVHQVKVGSGEDRECTGWIAAAFVTRW
jgi:hypothetical protein